MMTYTEFQNEVLDKITRMMGADCEVKIREVPKNNGVRLMGLSIMEKDSDVCPTIYLESFYEAYREGAEISTVIGEIYKFHKQYAVKGKVNFDFFLDYSKVKRRIFLKMINYEENKEMLCHTPHVRFLDLAIVCYVACMNDMMGSGAIRVDNEFLKNWDVPKEELFADAGKNTREILGPEIKDMQEMVMDLLLQKWNPVTPEEIKLVEKEAYGMSSAVPMFIMTLRGGSFGAVCMYMEEWMEQFFRKCGRGFFILPSSVHELILIPEGNGETADSLRKMVREVNEACVSPEEKLSDSVYYYDPAKKRVELT